MTTERESTSAKMSFARQVVATRTAKKIRRALDKVSMDRADCTSQRRDYTDPPEAAWTRRGRSWTRAGTHNEIVVKPERAIRRDKQQRKRLAMYNADGEHQDREEGNVADEWRRSRRERQQNPNEGCTLIQPPRRAKKNAKRKQNYRANKKLRAVREAAFTCLQRTPTSLPIASGHIDPQSSSTSSCSAIKLLLNETFLGGFLKDFLGI